MLPTVALQFIADYLESNMDDLPFELSSERAALEEALAVLNRVQKAGWVINSL